MKKMHITYPYPRLHAGRAGGTSLRPTITKSALIRDSILQDGLEPHTKSSARKYYSAMQRWMGRSIFLVRFACAIDAIPTEVRVSIEEPCRSSRWHDQRRPVQTRFELHRISKRVLRTNPGEISELDIAPVACLTTNPWFKKRVWWHLPRKSMIPKIWCHINRLDRCLVEEKDMPWVSRFLVRNRSVRMNIKMLLWNIYKEE